MRVDLTINIPTMISMVVLIASTVATGVSVFYSIDKRQMTTDFTVAELSRRMEKNEAAVSALKTDAAVQAAAIRGEMKSDIAEIKDLLNRLIFAPQQVPMNVQQRNQLKEWSK